MILDLYEIDLRYKRVTWIDGFDGMEAVIHYLKEQADREHSYSVGLLGTIHAVAFFACDNLLLLTGEGEVARDGQAGR